MRVSVRRDIQAADCESALESDAVTEEEQVEVKRYPSSLAAPSSLHSIVQDEFFDNSLGTRNTASYDYSLLLLIVRLLGIERRASLRGSRGRGRGSTTGEMTARGTNIQLP